MAENEAYVNWRNRLAYRLANAALRIATPQYRGMIRGSITYGLLAAARDVEESRESPVNTKSPFGI